MAKSLKKKLNQKSVEALKPRDKPYVVWDSIVSGFGVQVLPSGTKTLILHTRVKGRQVKRKLARVTAVTTTTEIAEVRQTAQQLVTDASLHGADPRTGRLASGVPSLGKFIDEVYLPNAEKRKATWKTDRQILRDHLPPQIKKKPLDEITRQDLKSVFDTLGKRRASTANRLMSAVREVYKLAAEEEVIPADLNPGKGLHNSKADKKRDRVLDADELRRFFEALDQYVEEMLAMKSNRSNADPRDRAAAIKLLFMTGCRAGELYGNAASNFSRTSRPRTTDAERVKDRKFGARWEHIDLDEGVWHKPTTKNGSPQDVPLLPEAIEVLREVKSRQGPDEPYVFPEVAGVRTAFERVCEIAGIKGFVPHSMRHQFVTELLAGMKETGARLSAHDVMGLTGHKSTRMIEERYGHHFVEKKRENLAPLSNVLGKVMSPEKTE